MKPEYLTRQSDLIPEHALQASITIIGAGAIGSFTALSLAKMGYSDITVYDDDVIEEENMNCQFYPIDSIGLNKVDALKGLIKQFTGVEIKAHAERVDNTKIFRSDILIAAVDNMSVRKFLFKDCFGGSLFIDPRMSAEYATIETVHFQDHQKRFSGYEKTLYTDEEAVQERCTAKSTIYTVLLIAGQIAKIVKDVSMQSPYARTIDWDIANNRMMAWDSNGDKL